MQTRTAPRLKCFGARVGHRRRRNTNVSIARQMRPVSGLRGARLAVEAGVGVGYTAGGDRLTFKIMLSRDLNKKHEPPSPEAKPPQYRSE